MRSVEATPSAASVFLHLIMMTSQTGYHCVCAAADR